MHTSFVWRTIHKCVHEIWPHFHGCYLGWLVGVVEVVEVVGQVRVKGIVGVAGVAEAVGVAGVAGIVGGSKCSRLFST